MEKSDPNLKIEQCPLKIQKFLQQFLHKQDLFDKHINAINALLKSNKDIDFDGLLAKDPRNLPRKKAFELQDKVKEIISKCVIDLEKHSYNTFKAYISSIKIFFEHYHINLEPTDWREIRALRTNHKKIGGKDKAPTKQEMQKILSNMDALETAFVLIGTSSGLRPGDILYIELNDLHLDKNPPEITNRVPCTATKKRLDFAVISKEAKKAIETYLPQRQRYFENKNIKILKTTDKNKGNLENKLFPISDRTIRERWNKKVKKVEGLYIIKKIGEKEKKESIYDLHKLRYYFRTYLGKSDLAEFLMGHTDMNNYYYGKQEEEAKKDYITLSNSLLINEESAIPEQVKKENLEGLLKIKQDIHEEVDKKLKEQMQKMNDIIKSLLPEPSPGYPKYHRGHRYENNERIDSKWDENQKNFVQVSKEEQDQINSTIEPNDPQKEWELAYDKIEKEHPGLTEEKYEHLAWVEVDKKKNKKTTTDEAT